MIIHTRDIKVADPQTLKIHCLSVRDVRTEQVKDFRIETDSKKKAIRIALTETFGYEEWISMLFDESTTWFDYQLMLLDVDVDVEFC
jgi:hypothetical protein